MNEREALKLALEALEFYYDLYKEKVDANAITAIKETLAQPEQKPVAWMREDEDCTDCIVWEQTEEHTIPLYTTPPQREWVGLTDEEKSDLWCKSTGQNCVNEDTHPSAQIMNLVIRQQGFNFAKAIEAKLREKNG